MASKPTVPGHLCAVRRAGLSCYKLCALHAPSWLMVEAISKCTRPALQLFDVSLQHTATDHGLHGLCNYLAAPSDRCSGVHVAQAHMHRRIEYAAMQRPFSAGWHRLPAQLRWGQVWRAPNNH